MKTIFKLCFIAFILSSCSSGAPKEVVINDEYSMEIPSSMTEAKELNPDASMGYMNAFLELYIMVIDDDKQEFNEVLIDNDLTEEYPTDFNGYVKMVTENYETVGETLFMSDTEKITVNGLDGRHFTLEAMIDDIEIYYDICLVRAEDKYYQLIGWTLRSRKVKHQETLKTMLKSFKVQS